MVYADDVDGTNIEKQKQPNFQERSFSNKIEKPKNTKRLEIPLHPDLKNDLKWKEYRIFRRKQLLQHLDKRHNYYCKKNQKKFGGAKNNQNLNLEMTNEENKQAKENHF
jgi:hypothetical protein